MALLRNPDWISGLEDSEVFVNFADDNPVIGKMGLLGGNWHTAGNLVEDGTVGLTRELTESPVNGAGFGVVARSFKPGAVSSTVDLLEENAVVRYIEWPDVVTKDGVDIKRHTGKVARGHVAIVRVREKGLVSIDVSRYPAYLTIPEQGRGIDAAGKTLSIGYDIGPQKDVLETRWFKKEGEAVVELDPKIFVDDSTITDTVADGTAVQIGGDENKEAEMDDDPTKPASGSTPEDPQDP